MNKQAKYKNGQLVGRGIEWTDFTWNPIGGCKHGCRWEMPDGSIAICYAEEVAKKFNTTYPHGFEYHYWHPERLDEPLKLKEPARIFLDSMSDIGGHWVPREQAEQVLDVCRKAHWHTFQLLTKNPKRLLEYDLPPNVWAGFSTPPDFMWGKRLSGQQQAAKLITDLEAMKRIKACIKWVSVEPLSWDVSSWFYDCRLNWAVIGAASNGPKKYQPDQGDLIRLLAAFDEQGIPVFFKGNLEWKPWREEFPKVEAATEH